MRKRFGAALWALSSAVFGSAANGSEETALDRYVAAPDSAYHYELLNNVAGDGYTVDTLEMTSQQWRSAAEVDRPIWKHWLTIVRPQTVSTSTSLLIVSGGSNEKPPPRNNTLLAQLALATNSVVSEIRMVPNQPLVFAGDGKRLTEDAITVFSWEKFLASGDETWPIRLPMTKSVVRAMDTITSFCASPAGGGLLVDKFVVGGASKRGWTAWTAAAVDKRVVGVIPVVIDLLNLEPSFEHHYRSYGFWAPAIAEFERGGIMQWSGKPQFEALMRIEDPYSYRDRLSMPKFIVNAAGDQYFLPDSWQFYFPGLKGDNYLRYLANTDHSLKGEYLDAAESALSFYQSILANAPRPSYSWSFADDGSIRVEAASHPTAVTLWQAHNPNARDFRLATIGAAFNSSKLSAEADGAYVGKVPEPKEGWTAFFVEMTFPTGGPYSYKFTTGVRVVPDRLPFGPPPEKENGREEE
jgi:PhoPQ-activated pathogenicity-related protein